MSTDNAIRPRTWNEYVGQASMKERLRIHIDASKTRGVRIEHILLVGPPGSGKTSIAQLIADELGQEFESFKCPIDHKTLAKTLREFSGVLFLDEIHMLSKKMQHDLYTYLEDQYLQLPSGAKIHNPHIAVVAATTEASDILAPLYGRFRVRPTFDAYSEWEMGQIVYTAAYRSQLHVTEQWAKDMGKAASGVPREAVNLVALARDLAIQKAEMPTVEEVLAAARVTPDGLTEDHVRYLRILRKLGGTGGRQVLASHLRQPEQFIQNLEVMLVQRNLITYTPSGRELTSEGFKATKEAQ